MSIQNIPMMIIIRDVQGGLSVASFSLRIISDRLLSPGLGHKDAEGQRQEAGMGLMSSASPPRAPFDVSTFSPCRGNDEGPSSGFSVLNNKELMAIDQANSFSEHKTVWPLRLKPLFRIYNVT